MISVALCSYNGEKYIREQLQSILKQSITVDEIIICDDRSRDNTIKEIEKIRHNAGIPSTIKVFVNECNTGVTKNFEKALSLCHGDVIFLSDQDDVWAVDKVEKMLAVFDKYENCQLVFTDAMLIDANGQEIGETLWERTKPTLKDQYRVQDFTGARFVTGATVALRRSLLNHTIPFPECWIHDAWLAANATVYGEVRYLDEKLIGYRQHESNVIGANSRGILEQIYYTKEHIEQSKKFRGVMKERFKAFLQRNIDILSPEEVHFIQRCIDFWAQSEQIPYHGILFGCKTILINLIGGNYKRFNHGIFGALVDLEILFFYHASKKKRI